MPDELVMVLRLLLAGALGAGVGFLGAGTIIHREGGLLQGLTTAASIWSVAAIGMAAATGRYALAAVAAALVLLVLRLPHKDRG